eukprot:g63250.t1
MYLWLLLLLPPSFTTWPSISLSLSFSLLVPPFRELEPQVGARSHAAFLLAEAASSAPSPADEDSSQAGESVNTTPQPEGVNTTLGQLAEENEEPGVKVRGAKLAFPWYLGWVLILICGVFPLVLILRLFAPWLHPTTLDAFFSNQRRTPSAYESLQLVEQQEVNESEEKDYSQVEGIEVDLVGPLSPSQHDEL